jgi:poly(A) polymerase
MSRRAAAPGPGSQAELDAVLEELRLISPSAWLVGGAVRDRLLGRDTADYDVVVDGEVRRIARRLAAVVGGHAFELSEGFGAWRVVARGQRADPHWQLDLLSLAQGSIEADLALRDFTVNALAQQLGSPALIDPFGGLDDLTARRLRMVSAEAFDRDPLRILRLARLAGELEFAAESQTAAQARRGAPGLNRVAPERIFEELKRIICAPDPLTGVGLMDEMGMMEVVLPELWALHGVEQSPYHHLDVYAHTLAVLAETVELERDPARHLGPRNEEIDVFMASSLANELTRWQALRFGALLHDIAKPQTRGVSAEGRVTFMGHDAAGAVLATEILTRLRASDRLREHVAALVRDHLRLGFLVHESPLSRRAAYRYLSAAGPVGVDVTVLSVADRLATRGQRAGNAIAKHLDLAREMLDDALRWQADPPRPPVRGDELARALGVLPGPALGRLLAELQEATFAGEIHSPGEAIERARQLLGPSGGHQPDR